MQNRVNILIVDNNHAKNSERERIIKENNLSNEVKIAMNAGHALLYLDHIHLNKKIHDSNLVVILNMDTPISNGYDFLNAYNHSSNLRKDRIHIIVVNENLNEEKQEKIKKHGVSDFIPDAFPIAMVREFIENRFDPTPGPRKVQKVRNDNFQPKAATGNI